MILRTFFNIVFLSLFSACATGELDDDFLTVDLDNQGDKETIVITENRSDSYGPSPEEGVLKSSHRETRAKVIALDLFPALYHSLSYVSTFIELEKKGLSPDIVSGTGFSSIVAALYAKYETSSMVEWKTFELYQLLGDKQPFNDAWRETIKAFLKKEFKDLKLNQLKKLLVVPSNRNGKKILNTNKKIVEAILLSLDLSNKSNMLLSNDYDYLNGLKKFGADFVFRISFLPDQIEYKYPDGYVFGVYSRLQGISANMASKKNVFVYSDVLTGHMDAFSNLSDTLYQTKDKNKAFALEVQKRLEEKSKNN